MSGTGKNDGVIQYLKEDYAFENNSTVYTSGSGGLFKAGIPIGKIKDLNLDKERKVNFFSDFTQLRFVKILSYEQEKIKAKEEAELQSKKEAKIRVEEEKIKAEEAKIKAEEARIKAEEEKIKAEEESRLIAEEEKIFQKLNKIYKNKCKKTIFNQLYKVGTLEYRNCILSKGIKKN